MAGGMVYIYTGEGEGKTTNALGLALRAVGHGYSAVIIQFMKGRKYIGEYKIKDRLAPEYEIHQFGREEFIDFRNPVPLDYELAGKGLEFAKEALGKKPRILVLDEINLAAHFGIVKTEDILKLLEDIPEETTVILTGRRAPEELVERADLVTEMKFVKHPFEKKVPAREGLEY
ncbi:cob(I)yrinic acid a,c-diamide adenosyltransferase [Methanosarcina mazei]|jgi:cob(I)alamin adenosyltransferase|uniref:Cob(I)alamin adenosyltransferase n=4 Tax=Methanosarcina mazei TaxID=2209 RepID=A0A0E3LFB7_METMZ|nr:cob(I)yrinic acid a,c-diamide adenosyltransferase [Methanosarcina mazei]AAM32834.1 Cob(I)alamin adenosyltransferase [Methanosarcina mazei Go1]AKB40491.1 Cob(I)alamin adenosyltransferase [Methanosarcina mazei WWM610]AKB68167.1 Cob(I)alamin adenosyltransferase [Methanosarcina mazei LYC]KKH56029.1 cobinamide adenolsyltransferase [Methanosarcina mazei]MDY0245747.1 cob(I)yrinic acid a,c-diamide adenosyltransferase [Methanosarcina mazei]